MPRIYDEFQTIHSEGGLLPPDLLRRLGDPKGGVPGTAPEDYGLPKGDRINEAITQSWNVLRRHWAEFRAEAQRLPAGDAGTGLTNDKWTLPLLRGLGFGPLPTTTGPEAGGRVYAISRMLGSVPIHLVGCGLSLDKRTAGARGAAVLNPHGLVQEFLNRKTGSLWGIVSNGLQFRILRDSQALSRQSYLEFDIEAMFAGEIYSDFVVLWLAAHATRFQEREAGKADTCWLEEWTKVAAKDGTRILGDLRQGVQNALQALGQGFVGHPQNRELQESLRGGALSLQDLHAQLLRVVYRLIFLFVAEDRVVEGSPLLHPRDDSPEDGEARARYAAHYGTKRLRRMAADIRGSRHGDLWQQFNLLVGALSGDERFDAARRHLSLPAFGGFLWSFANTAALGTCELTNADFLEAIRHLAFTRQDRSLRPVDYRNLGAEELGGVYEGLLALTPQIGPDGTSFSFAELVGNERKTSGSYYTPDSLVQCLLDSALDPVVEAAIKGKTGSDAEKALLALKVCDPAVGSGHFLVGAAHRLARHLARVRAAAQGESEPSPLLYQHALRDVIGRCLYGVDLNPMAAELCRVSLWLEALEPGKPLSFLDHHIRVGNSLMGARPELIAAGLPDGAFAAIEGDDTKACEVLRKRNKAERRGLGPLFAEQESEIQDRLQRAAAALEELPDDQPDEIRAKELAFRRREQTEEYDHKRRLADAWCAAFVLRKRFLDPGRESSVSGLTQGHLSDLASGVPLPSEIGCEVEQLTGQYTFFHWHLAFPEVFDRGGFSCVLGNPPWEEIQFEETSWFASRDPAVAGAQNAAVRKTLISALRGTSPSLFELYSQAVREVEATKHFSRQSGLYPAGSFGKLNTYVLFVEGNSQLTDLADGYLGCIVPTGVATDKGTSKFFEVLMSSGRLRSLFDFVNQKPLFPAIRPHQHFCLLTVGPPRQDTAPADIASFLVDVDGLSDPDRRYALSWKDVVALNPEAQTLSLFPSKRHAEVTRLLVTAFPALGAQTASGTWRGDYQQGTFNTASASEWFRTEEQLRLDGFDAQGLAARKETELFVPLFDAKLARQYEWRAANLGFSGHQFRKVSKTEMPVERLVDPAHIPTFAYWVPAREADDRLGNWTHSWLLGFKDVTGVTSTRLAAFALIPRMGVADAFPLLKLSGGAEEHLFVLAWMNSLLVECFLRQRMQGLHLTWHLLTQVPTPTIQQAMAVCPWQRDSTMARWVALRAAELSVTSWPLACVAEELGLARAPFKYDLERRFVLRAEIDAAMFVLSGLSIEDVMFTLDFLVKVKARDEQIHGEYRTRRVVVEMYEGMQMAIRGGQIYETQLDPPPADQRCCHPKGLGGSQ